MENQVNIKFPIDVWQKIAKIIRREPYKNVADIMSSLSKQINSELHRSDDDKKTKEPSKD